MPQDAEAIIAAQIEQYVAFKWAGRYVCDCDFEWPQRMYILKPHTNRAALGIIIINDSAGNYFYETVPTGNGVPFLISASKTTDLTDGDEKNLFGYLEKRLNPEILGIPYKPRTFLPYEYSCRLSAFTRG